MSAQPIERTDLDVIEHLDFEHVPACENPDHDWAYFVHFGNAYALVRVSNPCHAFDTYYCKPFYDHMKSGGSSNCRVCGAFCESTTVTTIALVGS